MEMPEGIGIFELYDTLAHVIQERIRTGGIPIEVTPGFWKLEGRQTLIYWYGNPSRIDLAIELSRRPQSLVVNMSGKRPDLRGQPPYASDLYSAILDDNDLSILMSDAQLSDNGLQLWRRLIELGYAVTVFDEKNPGQSHKLFTKPSELMQFFSKDNSSYRRWRYVLSKPSTSLGECISFFNLRRYRELAGLDLLG